MTNGTQRRSKLGVVSAAMRAWRFTLVAVAAVLAVPPATLAAVQPDVRAMAVRTADLPAGSRLVRAGDFQVRGAIAAYRRSFQLNGGRIGSAQAIAVEQFVYLTHTADSAQGAAVILAVTSHDLATRRSLGREILRLAQRRAKVDARQVVVGSPRRGGIRNLVFVAHVRVRTREGSIAAVYAGVAVDRVLSTLLIVSRPETDVRRADVLPLLRVAAGRIRQSLLPHVLKLPSIAGNVQVGETLLAGNGMWDPATAPTLYTYQWERCSAAGTACAALPGATGQAYNVANADRAATLRVAVTAENSVGPVTEFSAPTAVVS